MRRKSSKGPEPVSLVALSICKRKQRISTIYGQEISSGAMGCLGQNLRYLSFQQRCPQQWFQPVQGPPLGQRHCPCRSGPICTRKRRVSICFHSTHIGRGDQFSVCYTAILEQKGRNERIINVPRMDSHSSQPLMLSMNLTDDKLRRSLTRSV